MEKFLAKAKAAFLVDKSYRDDGLFGSDGESQTSRAKATHMAKGMAQNNKADIEVTEFPRTADDNAPLDSSYSDDTYHPIDFQSQRIISVSDFEDVWDPGRTPRRTAGWTNSSAADHTTRYGSPTYFPSSPSSIYSSRSTVPELALKICGVCLEERSSDDFPTRPITSTCTHPPDDNCEACLQQHLATQIASRGTAVLVCICHQPLTIEDVQSHALPADFARYSERAAIDAIEKCANFVWCPRIECSGGQIHEAGDDAPIVTCVACQRRFCYTHRVAWHAGISCTEYNTLDPIDQAEVLERAEEEISTSFLSPSPSVAPTETGVPKRPRRPYARTINMERQRQRIAEERAGEDFVRNVSGAMACPGCRYMTEKDGGCKHMTCQKCRHEYCWTCRKAWVSGHLDTECN